MSPTSESAQTPRPILLEGGCDCGAVRYTCPALPSDVQNCYCITCRKVSGAPFVPFGGLNTSDLQWTLKTPDVIKLRQSRIAVRAYCSICESHLYMKYHLAPDKTSITLGSLDEDKVKGEIMEASAHIFVEQKAKWFNILDGVKQFDRFATGFQERLDAWAAETASKTEL